MIAEKHVDYLRKSYIVDGKTDKEISEELGVDRTAIVHARKRHGIKTRETTGGKGEVLAKERMNSLGFRVLDMNDFTKTFPFDLLVNDYFRIEVKSSKEHKRSGYGTYVFAFTEKPANENIESPFRKILKNGRSRKIFKKTCDFLILVGIADDGRNDFFIVPSQDIPDNQQGIGISANPNYKGKYIKYKDNWKQLLY